jgi:hypothetical protein
MNTKKTILNVQRSEGDSPETLMYDYEASGDNLGDTDALKAEIGTQVVAEKIADMMDRPIRREKAVDAWLAAMATAAALTPFACSGTDVRAVVGRTSAMFMEMCSHAYAVSETWLLALEKDLGSKETGEEVARRGDEIYVNAADFFATVLRQEIRGEDPLADKKG